MLKSWKVQSVVIKGLVVQELNMNYEDALVHIANIFFIFLFFAFGVIFVFGACGVAVGVFCFILKWFGVL